MQPIDDDGDDSTNLEGEIVVSPHPPLPVVVLHDKLLRIIFQCCAKPHQLIAFGFNKLLEWTPQEIVRELSNDLLKELALRLKKDYGFQFYLCGEDVCFYEERDKCLYEDEEDRCRYKERIVPCFSLLLEKIECYVRRIYKEPEYRGLLFTMDLT